MVEWELVDDGFGVEAMQDNTLVILGLVGLALVCAGLFVFIGLTLFRVTGHRLLGFFSLLARDAADTGDERVRPKSPTPDLRSIASAQDFDSALARHGASLTDETESLAAQRVTQPLRQSPAAPTAFDVPETPRLGSRRSARPDVRRDDDEDLFGGLLEDEET